MPEQTIAPLTLVVGDEEFLVSRALEDLALVAIRADPATEVQQCDTAATDVMDVAQLLSPSLFGGPRLIIFLNAQDLPSAQLAAIVPMLLDPDDGAAIVVQHLGGAKGKSILEQLRAGKPPEVSCARVTRVEDRQQFLRGEVRRRGGRITADAAALLLDAVGSDLREIAAVVAQLVSDTGGDVDAAAVHAYHRGKAEVSGFAVADQAVVGNSAAAVVNLRWALNVGVPAVVIADALADGVRSVARVLAAGPGDPFALAPKLGMPPWKVKRARTQAQGWAEPGLRRALVVVAEANADVKGAAVDASYALESAIRKIADARGIGAERR